MEELEQPVEQSTEEIQAEPVESAEEDDSLPFPTARVVRLMKEEMKSGKQIRGEVKGAINLWLGNLLKRVAREMDATQYGSIGMADFMRATKPYDMIEDILKDRERLVLSLEKIKVDADQTKRDMGRFFENLTGKKQEEATNG